MNKLKLSFLLSMFFTSVSVFAGYTPVNVQNALKRMYPAANDIAWSQDGNYYVADFMMNAFDTRVWFNSDAQWVMKQTDWVTMDEVPAAVFNAFAASQFAGGEVQNVTWVQFPKWQSIVAVEIGMPNVQTKYQILFTPDGGIINDRNVTYLHNILGASTFL